MIGDFDLVVLDWMLPGVDVIEILKWVRIINFDPAAKWPQ